MRAPLMGAVRARLGLDSASVSGAGEYHVVAMRGCVERYFAFAAIAALQAFLADMVVARVFGAPHANPRRRLIANTALEWHRMGYLFLGGWLGAVNRARQRCASLSITCSCCS